MYDRPERKRSELLPKESEERVLAISTEKDMSYKRFNEGTSMLLGYLPYEDIISLLWYFLLSLPESINSG